MNLIARFLAPRALFTSVVRAHLVVLLVCSFSAAALAVEISSCGDGSKIEGRYIVRATTSSLGVSQKSTSRAAEKLRSSRLIHQAFHTPSAVGLVNSHSVTEKSTGSLISTFASELSESDLSDLVRDESVLSIEEDCLVQVDALPNDPVAADASRSRDQLNLPAAWSTKTDSSSIIVAVSDTGADLAHEDLAGNLWTNTIELNGRAGVDDDGNGCIDDVHGCDFGDYDGDPSPPRTSQGGHGTHVAGIIGAVGENGKGVNGVAWRAQLLIAKGFDAGGYAAISDLVNTIYYSINNGARVINCSWGADRSPTIAEREAFKYAQDSGVLAVVAAGNSSIDASRTSPASLDTVLTVGSINSRDQVSAFSNYGSRVQVYAPGGDAGVDANEYITSTFPSNQYGPLRGTSMAAPFVTGIASLVFATNPRLSAIDVRTIIVSSSREVSSRLPDGTTSVIRIPDAAAALALAATYPPTPYGAPSQSSSPTYQSPKADHSTPEFVETSSSTSCALKRDGSIPGTQGLVFLVLPLIASALLRRRFKPASSTI